VHILSQSFIITNNGYPTNETQNLKAKIEKKHKQQQQQNLQNETAKPKQKWAVFTYHSPLIRKVTNLFKQTQLKVSFRATNTIQQQLTETHLHTDPSGIYKFKCNTCSKSYVGQSGRSIKVRYKEHIRYIRTNNPTSTCATHILEDRHEYGEEEQTLTLLKRCRKESNMDASENFFIQIVHQQGILIEEQQVNDPNPLYLVLQTP
jgi:hypothetical protein